MIGYLKGTVIDIFDEGILLETGGVGYEVLCSAAALSKAVKGKTSEVFTYMQVKEDGVALFGFDTKEEKKMFLKLISVSGVGPKMGIAVLSGLSLTDIVTAIASSDIKTLSRVKGLGKKTAERIVLELREGVGKDDLTVTTDSITIAEPSGEVKDAIIALTGLGFNSSESKKAVGAAVAAGAKTIEDIIAFALRSMS